MIHKVGDIVGILSPFKKKYNGHIAQITGVHSFGSYVIILDSGIREFYYPNSLVAAIPELQLEPVEIRLP